MAKSPNSIDVYVGARVRERRNMLRMSQEKLADALGLTFQQVQKYERGSNRMGASRLVQIAAILRVPVSHFFEGAPEPGVTAPKLDQKMIVDAADAAAFNATPLGVRAATAFARMEPRVAGKFVSALEIVARAGEDDDDHVVVQLEPQRRRKAARGR